MISTPGANMVTQVPKLEKAARVSVFIKGVEHEWLPSRIEKDANLISRPDRDDS